MVVDNVRIADRTVRYLTLPDGIVKKLLQARECGYHRPSHPQAGVTDNLFASRRLRKFLLDFGQGDGARNAFSIKKEQGGCAADA